MFSNGDELKVHYQNVNIKVEQIQYNDKNNDSKGLLKKIQNYDDRTNNSDQKTKFTISKTSDFTRVSVLVVYISVMWFSIPTPCNPPAQAALSILIKSN